MGDVGKRNAAFLKALRARPGRRPLPFEYCCAVFKDVNHMHGVLKSWRKAENAVGGWYGAAINDDGKPLSRGAIQGAYNTAASFHRAARKLHESVSAGLRRLLGHL